MKSIVSSARLTAIFKFPLRRKTAPPIGLAFLLFSALLGVASAQPAPACRTPAVEARIAQLTQQIAAIDAQEDPIRAEVTDRALKGLPVSNVQARLQPFELQKQPLQAELAQLERLPPCAPRVYNAPYNAPMLTPWEVVAAAFGIYNAPTEPGGGWYFGPTGSASFLRDSDIIKRFEPRTIDTFSTSRSTSETSIWRLGSATGSTSWLRSSNSWLSSSDSFRIGSEGGSKTKLLTSNTGYDVGARAGYQFPGVRIEGLFDYANNSVDTFGNPRRFEMPTTDFVMRERSASGSTTSKVFLINGFIDVPVPFLTPYGATPYFGGGIGAGETSLDLKWGNRTIVNSSDWGVAYDLGAGVQWQVTPSLSLDLGYRYKGVTDVTLRTDFGSVTVPNRSHNFEASLVWKLPWGTQAYPSVLAPAAPYAPVVPTYPPPGQQLPPGAYPTQRF